VAPAGPTSTLVRGGNLQAARQGMPFAAQLTAAVTDGDGRPVPGAVVAFRVWSGAAVFGSAGRVATARTNAAGIATAPVLAAGGTVGPVRVTALAAGSQRPATYALRVAPY